MAHYVTTIESNLPPEDAFAYMADFSNTRFWDPSVTAAHRVGDGPVEPGTAFDLVTRFGGREVPLRYAVAEHEPPRRIVLEAQGKGFTSRDTITVAPSPQGSTVTYDAVLAFQGARRLLDPVMQRIFTRVGDNARDGMQVALNR